MPYHVNDIPSVVWHRVLVYEIALARSWPNIVMHVEGSEALRGFVFMSKELGVQGITGQSIFNLSRQSSLPSISECVRPRNHRDAASFVVINQTMIVPTLISLRFDFS